MRHRFRNAQDGSLASQQEPDFRVGERRKQFTRTVEHDLTRAAAQPTHKVHQVVAAFLVVPNKAFAGEHSGLRTLPLEDLLLAVRGQLGALQYELRVCARARARVCVCVCVCI
jgi:hypothetical protein